MVNKKKYLLITSLVFLVSFSIIPVAQGWIIPPCPDPPGPDPEKIGVILWNSDVFTQSMANEYKSILSSKGYTKFFCIEDPDPVSVFIAIDNYEIIIDTIFFYFHGHGRYDYNEELSYWNYRDDEEISSEDLRDLMDNLEAERRGFIMEACYAGKFVDHFMDEPYLAMSTSDEWHESWAYGTPGEGVFSDYFWDAVANGDCAFDAFYYAWIWNWDRHKLDQEDPDYWPWQGAKISDESTYTFFD